MKRLNQECIDIMYDILDKVRRDFPSIKFTWRYHAGLGNYCLMYDKLPKKFYNLRMDITISL